MALTFKKLGDLIIKVSEKNKQGLYDEVLGIAIEKEFMPSVANTIGTDLKKYNVVRKNRFAFNPMHVGRDEKLPIAVYHKDKPALVSPAYFMFELKDNDVDIDFLMLIFKSASFDHLCWFHTDASVRGGLTWEDFTDIEVNIPNTIEEQQKIVSLYKNVSDRIDVLEKLNKKLMNTANINYLNYINSNEFNEIDISSLAKLSAGGDTPQDKVDIYDDEHPIPIYSNGTTDDGLFGYTKKAKIKEPSITISARGYIGYTVLHTEPYTPVVRLISVTPKDRRNLEYLYFYFRNLSFNDNGSAQQQATIPNFRSLKCLYLSDKQLTEFNKIMEPFFSEVSLNKKQIYELKKLCNIVINRNL